MQIIPENWSIIKKIIGLYNIWNIRIAPLQNQKNDTIYGCILIIIVQTNRQYMNLLYKTHSVSQLQLKMCFLVNKKYGKNAF